MGARVTEGTFDGAEVGHRRSIGQVAFASFIGTAVEWYDFFVYGTAAALVFPKLFFPRFDPLAARSALSQRSASAFLPVPSAVPSPAISAIGSVASPCSLRRCSSWVGRLSLSASCRHSSRLA
jgi:hypothetical protein